MSHGAIQIANDGKCCKVTKRRQGLVTLAASNTIQALTADASLYFQKLWLYPGKAIASGVLTPNSAVLNVGDNGQQYVSVTLTSCAIVANASERTPLLVTCVYASHGFATGDLVTIAGAADAAFNGIWAVTVVDANTFTFTLLSPPKNGNAGAAVTASGWQAVATANKVTPDLLNPTDLPLKYELPLGQSQPLSSILIQGTQNDGVFYRLWA